VGSDSVKQPLDEYLAGRQLFGDDLPPEEIERWFEQERNAYVDLGQLTRETYRYRYHALNIAHGFGHLPPGLRFPAVLSVGGAFGDEIVPIQDRVDHLTVLDSSNRYEPHRVGPVPVSYRPASPDGRAPFPDASFDLLLCFGTLQYVPNASTVVGEFYRTLRPGAFALLREVTISLGDWQKPRKGLSRWERGVPLPILRDIVRRAGFEVRSERRCIFGPLSRLAFAASVGYDSRLVVSVDGACCRLFDWNRVYHARRWWEKLRPSSVFLVLRKPVV